MASNIRVVLEVDNKKYLADIRASDAATQGFAKNAQQNTGAVNSAFTRMGDTASGIVGKLDMLRVASVSYTHLTLPTICSV